MYISLRNVLFLTEDIFMPFLAIVLLFVYQFHALIYKYTGGRVYLKLNFALIGLIEH